MSLKAKIEAVIYAAEEPVTLAQLAAIFAADVPFAEPKPAVALSPELAFFEGLNPLGASGHEVTLIDAGGTMADQPHAAGEAWPDHTATAEAAPLLAEQSELMDNVSIDAAADFASNGSSAGFPAGADHRVVDAEAAGKRAARQREREIREHLSSIVEELITDYVDHERGIEIREIAGGFRMATKPEYHDGVRAFVKSLKPVMKLSLQALETLAVIAYKQPVTAPEVAEIRGVDAGGVLAGLISRKLVTTAGRKQVIGRPILYKTTKEFLLRFGLKDIAELPSMEEFEKMAGELAESDAIEADSMHAKAGIAPATESSDSLAFEATPEPDQENTPEPVSSQQAPEQVPSSQPAQDGGDNPLAPESADPVAAHPSTSPKET